jgi:hypothetical protein
MALWIRIHPRQSGALGFRQTPALLQRAFDELVWRGRQHACLHGPEVDAAQKGRGLDFLDPPSPEAIFGVPKGRGDTEGGERGGVKRK